MDYKALQSVFCLGENFLYVTNNLRLVQWDFNNSTYFVVDDPGPQCPVGSIRFHTKIPRSSEQFAQMTNTVFIGSPLHVPLRNVYLDYDVHMVKAIIGNIMLTLCSLAEGKLNVVKDKKAQDDLNQAFSDLDNEYDFSYSSVGITMFNYLLSCRFRRCVRGDWPANGFRTAVERGSLGISKVRSSSFPLIINVIIIIIIIIL